MRPSALEAQLMRQLSWLREPWLWLMRNRVMGGGTDRKSALDVGCGPGLVMELFSPYLRVIGVDSDPSMVVRARAVGRDAVVGDALNLPFENGSFDIVYCSFTLLWVGDMERAIKEMTRVARECVVCLAEPDYGGRICHPPEVARLDRALIESLRAQGADPFAGRKLGMCMERAGLNVELGIHSDIWTPSLFRKEAEAEWETLVKDVAGIADRESMDRAKAAWERALADGSLFLFNPVFYAIGRKG